MANHHQVNTSEIDQSSNQTGPNKNQKSKKSSQNPRTTSTQPNLITDKTQIATVPTKILESSSTSRSLDSNLEIQIHKNDKEILKNLNTQTCSTSQSSHSKQQQPQILNDQSPQQTQSTSQTFSLPDVVDGNVNILFVGISPGYHSLTKRHYAGPTNHFWECLYRSGLTDKLLNCYSDHVLPQQYKIGLTNISNRVLNNSLALPNSEQKIGVKNLLDKLNQIQPKIIAFNGISTWKIFAKYGLKLNLNLLPTASSELINFTGVTNSANDNNVNNVNQNLSHKTISGVSTEILGSINFYNYGRQIDYFKNILIYCLPSSSARCVHFNKLEDKIKYYAEIKQVADQIQQNSNLIRIDRNLKYNCLNKNILKQVCSLSYNFNKSKSLSQLQNQTLAIQATNQTDLIPQPINLPQSQPKLNRAMLKNQPIVSQVQNYQFEILKLLNDIIRSKIGQSEVIAKSTNGTEIKEVKSAENKISSNDKNKQETVNINLLYQLRDLYKNEINNFIQHQLIDQAAILGKIQNNSQKNSNSHSNINNSISKNSNTPQNNSGSQLTCTNVKTQLSDRKKDETATFQNSNLSSQNPKLNFSKILKNSTNILEKSKTEKSNEVKNQKNETLDSPLENINNQDSNVSSKRQIDDKANTEKHNQQNSKILKKTTCNHHDSTDLLTSNQNTTKNSSASKSLQIQKKLEANLKNILPSLKAYDIMNKFILNYEGNFNQNQEFQQSIPTANFTPNLLQLPYSQNNSQNNDNSQNNSANMNQTFQMQQFQTQHYSATSYNQGSNNFQVQDSLGPMTQGDGVNNQFNGQSQKLNTIAHNNNMNAATTNLLEQILKNLPIDNNLLKNLNSVSNDNKEANILNLVNQCNNVLNQQKEMNNQTIQKLKNALKMGEEKNKRQQQQQQQNNLNLQDFNNAYELGHSNWISPNSDYQNYPTGIPNSWSKSSQNLPINPNTLNSQNTHTNNNNSNNNTCTNHNNNNRNKHFSGFSVPSNQQYINIENNSGTNSNNHISNQNNILSGNSNQNQNYQIYNIQNSNYHQYNLQAFSNTNFTYPDGQNLNQNNNNNNNNNHNMNSNNNNLSAHDYNSGLNVNSMGEYQINSNNIAQAPAAIQQDYNNYEIQPQNNGTYIGLNSGGDPIVSYIQNQASLMPMPVNSSASNTLRPEQYNNLANMNSKTDYLDDLRKHYKNFNNFSNNMVNFPTFVKNGNTKSKQSAKKNAKGKKVQNRKDNWISKPTTTTENNLKSTSKQIETPKLKINDQNYDQVVKLLSETGLPDEVIGDFLEVFIGFRKKLEEVLVFYSHRFKFSVLF